MISLLGTCHIEKWAPFLRHQIDKMILNRPNNMPIEVIISSHLTSKYFSSFKILKKEIDEPIGLTRNRLLDASSGRYKFFLDQDDIQLPNRCSYQISEIDRLVSLFDMNSLIVSSSDTLNYDINYRNVFKTDGQPAGSMCFYNSEQRFKESMSESSSVSVVRLDKEPFMVLLNHKENLTYRFRRRRCSYETLIDFYDLLDSFEKKFLLIE